MCMNYTSQQSNDADADPNLKQPADLQPTGQFAQENILELHVVRTIYSDEQRPKLWLVACSSESCHLGLSEHGVPLNFNGLSWFISLSSCSVLTWPCLIIFCCTVSILLHTHLMKYTQQSQSRLANQVFVWIGACSISLRGDISAGVSRTRANANGATAVSVEVHHFVTSQWVKSAGKLPFPPGYPRISWESGFPKYTGTIWHLFIQGTDSSTGAVCWDPRSAYRKSKPLKIHQKWCLEWENLRKSSILVKKQYRGENSPLPCLFTVGLESTILQLP